MPIGKNFGKRYEVTEEEEFSCVIELYRQGHSYFQIRQQIGDGRLRETFSSLK